MWSMRWPTVIAFLLLVASCLALAQAAPSDTPRRVEPVGEVVLVADPVARQLCDENQTLPIQAAGDTENSSDASVRFDGDAPGGDGFADDGPLQRPIPGAPLGVLLAVVGALALAAARRERGAILLAAVLLVLPSLAIPAIAAGPQMRLTLTVHPSTPAAGDEVEIGVRLENTGETLSGNQEVTVRLDDSPFATIQFPALEVGASSTKYVTWTAIGGTHTFRATTASGVAEPAIHGITVSGGSTPPPSPSPTPSRSPAPPPPTADVEVIEISVRNATERTSEALVLRAVILNNGTAALPSVVVRFFLDGVARSFGVVNDLAPGARGPVEVFLDRPPEGEHTASAWVDPAAVGDGDTSDNSASTTLRLSSPVPPSPRLPSVEPPSLAPAPPRPLLDLAAWDPHANGSFAPLDAAQPALRDRSPAANVARLLGIRLAAPPLVGDGSFASPHAMQLLGAGDHLAVARRTLTPDAYSVEAWFLTTAPQGDLVGFGEADAYQRGLHITAEGLLAFEPAPGEPLVSDASVADGQWHHAVATIDAPDAEGAVVRLYVDGELVGEAPRPAATGREGAWRIGAGEPSFVGLLARVRILDAPLPAYLAAELASRPPGDPHPPEIRLSLEAARDGSIVANVTNAGGRPASDLVLVLSADRGEVAREALATLVANASTMVRSPTAGRGALYVAGEVRWGDTAVARGFAFPERGDNASLPRDEGPASRLPPQLTLDGFSLVPPEPIEGEASRAVVLVTNQGTTPSAPTTAHVRLVGMPGALRVVIPALLAGQSAPIDLVVPPMPAGSREIVATLGCAQRALTVEVAAVPALLAPRVSLAPIAVWTDAPNDGRATTLFVGVANEGPDAGVAIVTAFVDGSLASSLQVRVEPASVGEIRMRLLGLASGEHEIDVRVSPGEGAVDASADDDRWVASLVVGGDAA